MKKIKLPKGRYALVDDIDYENLNCFKWHTSRGYALSQTRNPFSSTLMHRKIVDAPKGMEVDHKNGNRLDNRRQNLRICTKAQNQRNQSPRLNSKSGFKGVHLSSGGRWIAQIRAGQKFYLGSFANKIDAAKAYNEGAKKYHGEFARLNIIK